MGRPLVNDFSWSKSRHEKLSECSRAYYLHYYRSWGGWDVEAPEASRLPYILKKLSNRYTWAGSVVHDSVRRVLTSLRWGRPVDPEKVIQSAHVRMQNEYRYSRSKTYWQERRKEFSGLVEHEYGEPIAGEEWKQNWETVKAALSWFLRSRWMELGRTLPRDQWLEVDELDFEKSVFSLDGVKVFAVPDFAYLEPDGTPVVVDWKTGKAREGYDEQVLGYALYLSNRYRFPIERIRASLVYLNEGIEQTVQVDAGATERFQAYFQKSVVRMRTLLKDPAGNAPLPESEFPMTANQATCARCVFRRLCGRDGLAQDQQRVA